MGNNCLMGAEFPSGGRTKLQRRTLVWAVQTSVNVRKATNFIHSQMVKMVNCCNMHFIVIHILL